MFGSWTYSALKLNVEPDGVDMKDYLHNGEWNVLGYPMKRNVKNYSDNIPFADVTLSFRIKRQPLYYTLNLILPCTVIAILAFLSFALPTSHGERVSLVITVLLAMSVYMLIVSSTLPQTSDAMPIIGTYFLCIIVEIAMCLLATCLVCKLQDHEGDIPRWLDNFLNKRVARLLFIRTTAEDYEEIPKIEKVNGHSKQIDLRVLSTKLTESSAEIQLINKKMLQKLQDELAVLTNDVKKRQKHNAKQRKWKNAARVLDRLFLVLFPFVFIIVTTAVFASKA